MAQDLFKLVEQDRLAKPEKLEKLKIIAFENTQRQPGQQKDTFVAMFNPASYSQVCSIPWRPKDALNSSQPELDYVGSLSNALTLNLLLDGTGVDPDAEGGEKLTVKERVQKFFHVTLKFQGEIHEPYYLIVEWGALQFRCRLSKVTVKYTSFDRQGNPLRAELTVEFLSDKSAERRSKEEKPASPDLTHSRIIRNGDTLPLLTREMYGSPDRYLDVARYNGLDDFRRLTPGQELLFPPIIQLRRTTASGGR